MKRALVLGAGLVSKPLIDYLLEHNIHVTVASKDFINRSAIDSHTHATSVDLDLNNKAHIETLVTESDIVISLLPYAFHVEIATLCIRHKKNMVTASYVSDAMSELDQAAKDAGIIIMNEVGLDPGIDHMSAMQVIDEIKSEGGELTSFISNCGGLPLWDAVTTPFKYKFSWSPEGVVLAATNSAQYLENGHEIRIPKGKIFNHHKAYNLGQFGQYEVYPNRDSLKYIDVYGLTGIQTMYRGTFRNLGWCDLFSAMMEINLLDQEKQYQFSGVTYHQFMKMHLDVAGEEELASLVSKRLKISKDSEPILKLEWLGLFEDEAVGIEKASAFDVLCHLLKTKLQYNEGERDLVVMQHEFEAIFEDRTEIRTSLLISKGEKNGASAMARTVGLPAAIVTKLILDDKISLKGVQIPLSKEVYEPTLKELESFGISFKEKKSVHYNWV